MPTQKITQNKFKKDLLQKHQPSWWLEEKYNRTLLTIKSGKVTCDQNCKMHLDQIPSLIEAGKMIEGQSTDPIFIYLGYQALDNAL